MKTIIFYLVFTVFSWAVCEAQTVKVEKTNEIEVLKKQKETIVSEEKEALRIKIETINQKLAAKEISMEKADQLKEEAAKKHALNIENRIAIIDNKIALLDRNDEDYNSDSDNTFILRIGRDNKEPKKEVFKDDRTTSTIVLAAGFNNALKDGQSLNDSDFKIGGSRFFEIGWAWKTRVFENSNWLRFKYGVSFQFNGLKPKGNRIFVENGELTELEEFDLNLNKSKFRMDNVVVPIHFEFGPSSRTEKDGNVRFSSYKKFKIGLGGFAGFNLGERQKLKFEVDGDKEKDKLKGDYNTNDLVYGLSGYLGWGGTAVYLKYDLNPIFSEPNADLNNVSLGLRFDLD